MTRINRKTVAYQDQVRRCVVSLFLLTGLITSCAAPVAPPPTPSVKEKAFLEFTGISSTSSDLHLRLAPEFTDTANGSITIWIENQGRTAIVFDYDFRVQLLVFSAVDNQWSELSNGMLYGPKQAITLLPIRQDAFRGAEVLSVIPDLKNHPNVTTLRIVVRGTAQSASADEVVGYIDVPTPAQK